MLITKTHDSFIIQFPFRWDIVNAIKLLPEKRWEKQNQRWIVPIEYESSINVFAQKFGFKFKEAVEDQTIYQIPPLPELTYSIPLKKDLFPFQRNGVAYALQKKRLIIGDEPGLGKTLQAIATITAMNAFPCLIICPNNLKLNWQKEIKESTNRRAMILSDPVKNTWHQYYKAGLAQFFIVNYESLAKYFVAKIVKKEDEALRLNHIHFKESIHNIISVICDESHRLKNTKTKQTKFTKGITDGKEYRLLLTGTPVVNKPRDLASQLGIIGRMEEFGGWKGFEAEYCQGMNEASNLRKLNFELNRLCFYRRRKSEVLKDLPPKTYQVIYCELDKECEKEYKAAEANLAQYLRAYKEATDEKVEKAMRGEIMVRIGILKQIAARGKIKDVGDFIEDVTENDKFGIFGHHKEVLRELKNRFPNHASITGEDSNDERFSAVKRFQEDERCKLFIGSQMAAGEGITLTAASRMGFIEIPWTYKTCVQCEDRFHRIGQEDNVQCTYFLAKGTIDDWCYQLVQNKKIIADAVMGDTEQQEVKVIDSLFEFYQTKNEPNETA